MFFRERLRHFFGKLKRPYATHNRIEISRSAIIHNLALFKHLSGKDIIPVLKGNAYGHGIDIVTKALRGSTVPYIAVDGYFEALRIRRISNQPVLIMGSILPQNYANMRYKNFTFVVHEEDSVHALGKTGVRIRVHLECNTGMNRYGVKLSEIDSIVNCIHAYKNLHLEGVMTHLADADGDVPNTLHNAVDIFDACVERVRAAGANPTMFHIAQTLGSIQVKSKYANVVRLGIGLYGVDPFPKNHSHYGDLKDIQPAMRLVSTIAKVITLTSGDKVGYNYTFTAPKDMTIGVLPLGYHEGVHRALSNTGIVKIGEKYAPIIGKICMNHTMIDVTDLNVQKGNEVIVYSGNPTDKNSIPAIAYDHHLFSYNLIAGLSPDVRRILVD